LANEKIGEPVLKESRYATLGENHIRRCEHGSTFMIILSLRVAKVNYNLEIRSRLCYNREKKKSCEAINKK